MKNRLMKKITAASMAFVLAGGAVSVPVDGKPVFSSALTAKAIGFSATLNESTGVLTINGEVPESPEYD